MKNSSTKQLSPNSITSLLNELSRESQAMSPDDSVAFRDWDKRFRRICYLAGEKPFELCCNFYKRHSPGLIMLGEFMPESRNEIASKLKDAPDCIRAIIDVVKIYGIVPIKKKTKRRKR